MGAAIINKGVAIPGAASVILTNPSPYRLFGRSERCVFPLDKRSLLTLIDQVSGGLSLDLGEEGLDMFGYQLVRYAQRVNPLMDTLLGKVQYYWVTAQCEYATDVMFPSVTDLKALYSKLRRSYR